MEQVPVSQPAVVAQNEHTDARIPFQPFITAPAPRYAQQGFVERHAPGPLGEDRTRLGATSYGKRGVDYFVPDTPEWSLETFMTCIREMNSAPIADVSTICSMYSSAITVFFTDLKQEAFATLRSTGYEPAEIKLPSQAGANGVEVVEHAYYSKCLVLMSQLCMIPFKNIAAVSYIGFMDRRINALKACAGVPSTEEELLAIETVERAALIRSVYGSSSEFRRSLLLKIVAAATRQDIAGAVFAYVNQILSWTEMSTLTFICDTLLSVKSPILWDIRVKTEVKNLVTAFKVVTHFQYPQFFRILGPAREMALIERSRFPTLAAVAQKLRAAEFGSARQFVVAANAETPLVTELVGRHNSATLQSSADIMRESLEYLTHTAE